MSWGRKPLEGPGSRIRLSALAAKFRKYSASLDPERRRPALATGILAVAGASAGGLGYLLLFETEAVAGAVRSLRDIGGQAARAKPYYANCAAARDAGAAPLSSLTPGFRPELDRDGDGIACEPYPPH